MISQPLRARVFWPCLLLSVLCLSACGFRLRGEAQLAFASIYLSGPPGSPVLSDVRRLIRSAGKTSFAERREDAQVTLQILADAREKQILSLSGGGTVREFQLRQRVLYRISNAAEQNAFPTDEILITRVVSYNDTQILAKEREADLLYREMHNDAVEQIMQRLASVKPR